MAHQPHENSILYADEEKLRGKIRFAVVEKSEARLHISVN